MVDLTTRLQIEAQCIRTVNRYSVAVGEQDHEAFASCFTEDGVWRRPGTEPMHGRAEIKKFMGSVQSADKLNWHVNGTALIDVIDDENAKGVSYTTVYNCDDYKGGIAPMRGTDYVVQYKDTFKKIGEEWLIATRDTTIVLRADYAADLPNVPNPHRSS